MNNAEDESQLRACFNQQTEQRDRIGAAGNGCAELETRAEPRRRLQGSCETAFEFFGKIASSHKPTLSGWHDRTKNERNYKI
jgi:hypothetical protein